MAKKRNPGRKPSSSDAEKTLAKKARRAERQRQQAEAKRKAERQRMLRWGGIGAIGVVAVVALAFGFMACADDQQTPTGGRSSQGLLDLLSVRPRFST